MAILEQQTFVATEHRITMRLEEMPLRDRPVERLYFYGSGALSSVEILAALVGGAHQLEIAAELTNRYTDPRSIINAPLTELEKVPHLGHAGAARLKAALEWARRLFTASPLDRTQIRSPTDAANLLMWEMGPLEQEQLRLILLDTKNRVIALPIMYIGNVNTAITRPAEIIRCALQHNTVGVILVHNHPSGDPTPSPEDINLTQRLTEAFTLCDIELLDHIIIGHSRFLSIKERVPDIFRTTKYL
jgi:DNA repair protein RadC